MNPKIKEVAFKIFLVMLVMIVWGLSMQAARGLAKYLSNLFGF